MVEHVDVASCKAERTACWKILMWLFGVIVVAFTTVSGVLWSLSAANNAVVADVAKTKFELNDKINDVRLEVVEIKTILTRVEVKLDKMNKENRP